ncbi:MAG: glycerophosphodiester phosphodiesterase [Monoglobaceae bacterium]
MNTVKFNKKDVKIIAHRGLSGIETENTNAAFVAAGNRSYWGIETDVHRTKDGVYVVFHDDSTGRISNKDLVIEETTYKDLCELTLYDVNGKQGRRDLIIPTLNDYISICKKYNKRAVLELKNSFMYEDIKEIVEIIESYEYLDDITFISFDFNNLVFLRQIRPSQKVQYLTCDFSNEILENLKKHKFDLDIEYHSINKEMLQTLKENNIEVNCWTCNDVEDGEKLVESGVDYITSNILE